MSRHDKRIRELAKIAEGIEEPVNSARVVAALVRKNDIISYGICQYKTSPFQKRFGRNELSISWHAETLAIRNALKQHYTVDELAKPNTILYVVRVKRPYAKAKTFEFGLARPCDGCRSCLQFFSIPKVIYTTGEEDVYSVWELN